MGCCISELRDKDVVNIKDGRRLGCVSDVEVDICCGKLVAIIVPGEIRGFFFGKCEEIRIPWDKIVKIGDDTILVDLPHAQGTCKCDKPERRHD